MELLPSRAVMVPLQTFFFFNYFSDVFLWEAPDWRTPTLIFLCPSSWASPTNRRVSRWDKICTGNPNKQDTSWQWGWQNHKNDHKDNINSHENNHHHNHIHQSKNWEQAKTQIKWSCLLNKRDNTAIDNKINKQRSSAAKKPKELKWPFKPFQKPKQNIPVPPSLGAFPEPPKQRRRRHHWWPGVFHRTWLEGFGATRSTHFHT